MARYCPGAVAYAGGYQTAQILPLYFNVTPPAHQASVVAALVESLTARAGPVHEVGHGCNGTTPCLASGFWGTRYALQALAQHGHADLSFALATKTAAPSWGVSPSPSLQRSLHLPDGVLHRCRPW